MSIPELALIGCGVAFNIATLVAVLLKRKGAKEDRAALGREYARIAVSHAQRMGGDKQRQLATALSAFRLADETADGKRDFTDAQARVYIEASLAEPSK